MQLYTLSVETFPHLLPRFTGATNWKLVRDLQVVPVALRISVPFVFETEGQAEVAGEL